MTDVQIHFTNDKQMSAENVALEETLTALIVHSGPGEKSVVPLANVLYYDVEASE